MAITLRKRKNDQYRKGHVSIISRSGKPTCPAGITKRLLSLLPDKNGSPNHVVCRIVESKRVKEKFHKSLGISFSSVREIVMCPIRVCLELTVSGSVVIKRGFWCTR